MRFNKKAWLLVFAWIITVVILAPANCSHDTSKESCAVDEEEKPRTDLRGKSSARESPQRHIPSYQPPCAEDDDCPSDSGCQNGTCVITNPTDDDEEEFDAGDEQATARSCVGDDDCGCGYQCDDDQCGKITEPFCCANADCGENEFCHFGEGESNPNGTCMQSECDTSEECDGCGMRCYHHLCDQAYCCANSDCQTGQRCRLLDEDTEGYCVVPECTSDANCGCGKICNTTYYMCTRHNPEGRYMQCCGTDFYYEGECVSHELIEDGRCLDDSHCPAGKVCYAQEMCLPATCTKNSDCGCESVCREGGCEYGCDNNSDCCDKGDTCDRGDCIGHDEE